MTMKKLILGIAAISLLAGSAALAADDDHRLDAAWKAAVEDNEGMLTPAQVAGLNILAFESAAARLCEGFKLDEKKYATSVAQVITGGEKLSEEDQVQRLSAVMFRLGTANGLFLSEGALNAESFCAQAAQEKADKDNPHNWQ